MGGQGRYLFESFQGEALAEYLNDRETETNRYALASKHTQNLGWITPGLTGYWNLNKVSDNTYFADLSDRVGLTSQTTLPREGGLTWAGGPWQVVGRAQAFQTLQDPNAPPQPLPYNRVPQLLVALSEVNWNGLAFAGAAEYAYFRQPTLTTGQRVYVWPTVAWEREGAAWALSARTGVHLRHYDLNEKRPDAPDALDYAIPITSLDARLLFERDWSVFGRDYVQTLEPRAFHVYVPYRDQTQAPVFDTALDDYNFSQLFSVNRYLGNDRIGDANQLTLAVTSRLIEPETGGERLRVSIGQRFYFADQQVVLNEAPRSAATSDLLVGAEGKLSDAWSIAALWQFNFDSSRTERTTAGLRYTPAPGRVFNASYTYSRQYFDPLLKQSELNQFDLSAQWPLTASLTLLGRWNYSLLDRRTLEAVAGIEYNAGCWVLRLVGQRLTTTTETTTNSIYLQLELNGLARFGTSPLDLLRRSVPGYQRTNDPTVSPRDRDDAFFEF
jgi:LPS-assembly protein